MESKPCNVCLEVKELDNFYSYEKESKTRGVYIYYHPECKDCSIKRADTWRRNNNERHLKAQSKSMKKPENRNRRRKAAQKYRDEGYQKNWQNENKDKLRQYAENRREKVHEISTEEWGECKKYFDYKCAYCGLSEKEHKILYSMQLHRDHFIDDGANDITNCIPACLSCNASKGEKDFYEWYPERMDIYSGERIKIVESRLNLFQ